MLCEARAISTSNGVVDFGKYAPSPALVTDTKHDPDEVDMRVPLTTAQPVAKPSMAVKLICPVPEPPDDVRVSGVPYVVLVLVSERDACSSRKTLNEYT